MNFHSQKYKIDFLYEHDDNFYSSSLLYDIVIEFHPSQFVTAQSIHESTKRRNRQVIMVDAQSRCKTW